MISSAQPRIEGGIVKPSALAVLRLITTVPVGEAVLIFDVAALDGAEALHAFLWVAGWPPAVAKRLAVRTTTSPIRRMGTSERMAGGESSRPESSVA